MAGVARSGNQSFYKCDSGKRATDAHQRSGPAAAQAQAGSTIKRHPVMKKRLSGA